MITLPACAWLTPSLPPSCTHPHLLALSLYLSLSFLLASLLRVHQALPGGHPLSAAMLPGNMIIVIICTLLRSYPPDSSPLRNSPVILPAWLPPFSLSLFLSPLSFPSPSHSLSLFLSIPLSVVVPSCVMLCKLSPASPFSSHGSLPPSLSRVILRLHSPASPRSPCVGLSLFLIFSLSATAVRRIERKRTRTGPKQPPVNRNRFPLSLCFPFRLSSCICVVLPVVLHRPLLSSPAVA